MANGASVIQGIFPNGLVHIVAGAQAVQPKVGRPDWVQQRIGQPRGAPPPRVAPIQRASPNGNAVQLPPNLTTFANVGGQPLPADVRQRMESFFGASFADVRIHIGPQAASIGARAFTHGSNIHFAPGQFDPVTARGRQVLGHELAHVVQQRAGRVRNPFGSGVAVIHDVALEGEAERFGQRAAMHMNAAPTIQPAVRRSSRAPKPKDLSRFEDGLPEYRHRAVNTAELKRDIPNFDAGEDKGRPFHSGMRLAGAASAAAYGAYHVADLVSLGLLSDADWYRAAVKRGDMSVLNAGARFAGLAAVKGGAAYAAGALNAGVRGAVAGAAITTRAGRWLYSWVDSGVATYQPETFLGETIKVSDRPVQAPAAEGNANTVMGMSASEAAGRVRKSSATSQDHYEWLHLVGRSLGGPSVDTNYVAGSFHANTEMIALESAIRAAADRGNQMHVCVTAFCVYGTDVANRINYKVFKGAAKVKVFEKTFDANRGGYSLVESLALQEAATAALADDNSWWGTARRFLGPR